MAQSSQLPPFGNWESEENYTAYFENARKKKGGGRMNPNDSQNNMPPVRAPPLEQEVELKGQMGTAAIRSKHERQKSHEDGQLQRLAHSPLHHGGVGPTPAVDDLSRQLRSGSSKVESEAPKGSDVKPQRGSQLSQEEDELRRPKDSLSQHETVGRRATVDSPYRLQGGPSTYETPKRVSRQSAGSDRSSDNSPLHGHFQARIGGKVSGVSSPSWEKKVSSEGLAPCTPGRSRLRSVTRGDDSVNFLFLISHHLLFKFALIMVLLFPNLAIGMRVTLHQLRASVKYSTKREWRSRLRQERFLRWQLRLLIPMVRGSLGMTIPRAVAAFRGSENEVFARQSIESTLALYSLYSLDLEGCLTYKVNFLVSALLASALNGKTKNNRGERSCRTPPCVSRLCKFFHVFSITCYMQ